VKTHQPIPLDTIFTEARQLIDGSKLPFFVTLLALLVVELFLYGLSFLLKISTPWAWVHTVAHVLLPGLVVAPLLAGLFMIGLKRIRSESLTWASGFQYFKKLPHIFVAFAMSALMLWLFFLAIGLLCLFFVTILHAELHFTLHLRWVIFFSAVGVLLLFSFYKSFLLFNFLLVLDQQVNPFLAWWRSCVMVAPHFGKIFVAVIFMVLANLIGLCLLGVGLIWTIPWTYLVIGKLYLWCAAETV
jgi:hypothetical protein